jgi:G patch domain-containing protein 1
VFEYLSSENKNRLDGALGFVLDVEGEKHMRKDHWEVPTMDKSAAEAALLGFMPFSDDVSKQQRYKQYLNVQAGLSTEKIEMVEGFSGEDMNKELNEFAQAARIFKPLSTSMSSRFTTASKVVEFQQPAPGLRSGADIQSSPAEKSSTGHSVVERMEIPVYKSLHNHDLCLLARATVLRNNVFL